VAVLETMTQSLLDEDLWTSYTMAKG